MKYFLCIILIFSCQSPTEQSELKRTPSASTTDIPPSKWPKSTAFPLSIKVGGDFSNDEKLALENAANSWNNTNSNSYNYFELSDSNFSNRNHLDEYKDSELGIYKIYNWPDEMPGTALAVTQIFGKKTSNGFISINHADILLNYDYFDFSATDDWGYDLQTVVLHELGHFLGLYHDSTSADHSVMYPTISRYSDNRLPHPHDEEQLQIKYSKLQAKVHLEESTEELEEIKIRLEIYADGSEKINIQRSKP